MENSLTEEFSLPISKMFTFTTEGMANVIGQKVDGLVSILNKEVIDMKQLKKHLAEGIPDEASEIRQFSWKLILGYLPEEKSKWKSTIDKQEHTYQSLVSMFLPEGKFQEYPLILKRDHLRFQELQQDYLLWEQIQKDTSRTHAQISFFSTPSKPIMLPYLTSARRQKFKLINGQDEEEYRSFLGSKERQRKCYRYDYMTRILYIYAKLNPKIQYVQGMNQILAPIFYLVNATKSAQNIQEASCFFMFNNAICDIIQLHIKDLDKSKNGIHGKMTEFNQMLTVIEPSVWKHMEELKINPFFYCFRWITLLYAQDFPLFDTLRIWESIFSNDNRIQYIKFFAIAIMVYCKDSIVKNDFSIVLQYLQDIKEHIIVNEVILIANALVSSHQNKDFSLLAAKGKKKIQKEWEKEREKKVKEYEREERNREKEEEKGRKRRQKEEKMKREANKQRQEKELIQEKNKSKEIPKDSEERGETKDGEVNGQKSGSFLKKFGNFVDKFLN